MSDAAHAADASGVPPSGASVRWSPAAPYLIGLALAGGIASAGALVASSEVRAAGILLALAVPLLFVALRVSPAPRARRWLALVLVPATLLLVFAGAKVTSHEAGLAVPDWPLSYGRLMPPMVGNIFYEHGHRMIATAVGMGTLVLALWTARADARRWVRALGLACLGAVVLQGVLGGITVIFLLPLPVSVAHGTLAQTFLCLLTWLAYATSREWDALRHEPAEAPERVAARAIAPVVAAATGAIWIQLVLGAIVRHAGAGLAVPFFPVSETGAWWPAVVDGGVRLHMAHRGFALVVVALVAWATIAVARRVASLRRHALGVLALVIAQAALGATVVLVRRAPTPTSVHVVTGAALLALTWWLFLRVRRRADAAGIRP